MKILFFINSLRSGGKERRMLELIKVVSSLPDYHIELVLMEKEIHYADIYDTNVKIHYVLRKGLKKDPRVFLKFYKIARKFRPDIIHVWGNLMAIYAIPAKFILKIPMVNNQITDAPITVDKSILSHRLTFPFSNLIIANSEAGLKSYSAPMKKSMVIYNGFDYKRLNNLAEKDLVRSKFNITKSVVIGMVASFSDKKDYGTFIKAMNILAKQGQDNICFLCIGAGDDSEYKKMVDSKIKDNVLFLGKQDNVESIMNICEIGVLTSNPLTHGEGISNALLEFMALGKPVVASIGGGTAELIIEEETGYLIEPVNEVELAERIERLVVDEEKRIRMGIKGKELVVNKFNMKKMADAFIEVYSKIGQKH